MIWNYTFPKGGGDTHFSVMKGSKADLVIRQGKEQNYQPELFVEAVKGMDLAAYEKDLTASMEKVSAEYPGVALNKVGDGVWQVEIPAKYRVGHEAHFGQVTEHFLDYLKEANCRIGKYLICWLSITRRPRRWIWRKRRNDIGFEPEKKAVCQRLPCSCA